MNKIKLNNLGNLPIDLDSETENLNKGYYLDNLLAGGVQTNINPTNDYEVVEFKYHRPNFFFNLNFFLNIFEDDNFIVNSVTDSNYNTYKTTLISELKKLEINKIGSYSLTDYKYKPEDYVKNSKPASDKISILNTVKPQFEGYPSFYQTLGYPFYFNVNAWKDNRFKYMNEPFLFNSFIKLDFYDSPKINEQNLLFSQTIHTNPRYTSSFKLNDTQFSTYDMLIPRFNIKEGVETYRINWIKNFYVSEYYVRAYFWDALTGTLINLLPTSDFTKEKQWVQNQDDFNTKNLFLKYSFDNVKNEYKIFEYNPKIDTWNLQSIRIELYQLIFDKYWAKRKPEVIIENNQPVVISDTNSKPSFEIEQYEINADVKQDTFNQKAFSQKLKIKNTGSGQLILDNITVNYTGEDERLTSDTVTTNNFNETPSYYSRNFYTFIQNQEDYMFLTPPEIRKKFTNDFPITTNRANQAHYRDNYGENLSVKILRSKTTPLKEGEERDIEVSFNLGENFYEAFVGKKLNIPDIIFGGLDTFNIVESYITYYGLDSLLINSDGTLRFDYINTYSYTVTFDFITSSGNKISKSLDVTINYSVKK